MPTPLGTPPVQVAAVWEPTVAATIVTPEEYTGAIMQLCQVGGWARACVRFLCVVCLRGGRWWWWEGGHPS